MTQIIVAKSAGFCFGVKRACQSVYQALSEQKKLYLLGELIHNSRVMNDILSKGGATVESVAEIPRDAIAVIRAHGVPRSVVEELNARHISYIDMTCPFVIHGRRSTSARIDEGSVRPTLNATPGDLSIVISERRITSYRLRYGTSSNNQLPDKPLLQMLERGGHDKQRKSCYQLQVGSVKESLQKQHYYSRQKHSS